MGSAMNKVLCTFGWGPAAEWLELTGPLMMKYAMKHGYSFLVWPELPKDKPDSWYKVDMINHVLSDSGGLDFSPDICLWLDADVVIKDFSKDILDDIPDGIRGNVVHKTKVHGTVPNCGVWINKFSGPTFFKRSDLEGHMWEQAAYCKLLGSNDQIPMSFPNGFPSGFQELPYEWNVIRHDVRGIPDNTRFFHATIDGRGTQEQRLALIKEWIDK